ncbi:ABC transporter substrate-binding protein [Thalassotalea euphylliae]|uniref:ABC transporter substrate-binding protein n=1 Tax=Thalassotalea euphylliae TaxID=1655234 RepID=A0A3E0TPQ6_9GAMM|nr:ABC transporter substrate-binding protein [Thalassotalea euphylliae]REL26300.1 ABC transporter substrate-binding protein [Thalassotalea euphylliae]
MSKTFTFKVFITIFILIGSVFNAHASTSSPYQTLETTGNSLFTRIAQQQQELTKFPELMRTIVEEELMPHVDYKYAAFRILGKQLKKTTKEERNKFAEAMRHYLIRTYATALANYKNQQVIYEPAKPFKGKRVVAVSTRIVDEGAPEVEIQFKMRRNKKTGQWKAYDMVVEGISLLESKKAELSRKIQQQGLSQVTLELASIAK